RRYERLDRAPTDELAAWLADLGLAGGRLGLELGYEQRLDLTVADFRALGAALPGAELVDAANLLWRLRMVKSEAENDRIRRACRITARAYDRFFPQAEVGMTEVELGRLFQRAAAAEGAQSSACFVLVGRGRYGRATTL